MATVHITKGHNIKISGAPEKRVVNLPCPSLIKIIPDNFRTVKPKLLVKEGDQDHYNKVFSDKNVIVLPIHFGIGMKTLRSWIGQLFNIYRLCTYTERIKPSHP